MLLVIFLGFGTDPRFHPELRRKVRKVIPFLKKIRSDYLIITSGWKGEAQWLGRFLVQEEGIPDHKVLLEEKVSTTYENIKLSLSLEKVASLRFDKMIFVGEAVNQEEVLWLAPRLFERIRGKNRNVPSMKYLSLNLLTQGQRRRKRWKIIFVKMEFYFHLDKVIRIFRKRRVI